jgi:hypothetical protein
MSKITLARWCRMPKSSLRKAEKWTRPAAKRAREVESRRNLRKRVIAAALGEVRGYER